jgi:hypothetical protein
MRKRTTFAIFVVFSLAACPAWADTGPSLSDARQAYAEVDYEGTRNLAQTALRRGGHARAATAELYLLWATAAAALGQAEEARTAFSFALAANPDLKLDKSLSPKIRAPYLEARGSLSGADGRPPLGVTLQRRKQELELRLHDALQVAGSIELATRADDASDFVKRRVAAAPTRRLPLPQGSELQFFLHVLDSHGNALFELGTEDDPQRLALVSSTRPTRATEKPTTDASPAPYYWTAGALATLGLAAGGVATVMFVRREDAARAWNGASCEQPGSTRGQQCASVDSRRRSAENLALGFGAAGGALLLGSLVTVILAPSSRHRATVALETAPGDVMLRLSTAL